MKLKPIQLFLTLGVAATLAACGGGEPAEEDLDTEEPLEEEVAPEEAPEGEEDAEDDEGVEGGEGGEG